MTSPVWAGRGRSGGCELPVQTRQLLVAATLQGGHFRPQDLLVGDSAILGRVERFPTDHFFGPESNAIRQAAVDSSVGVEKWRARFQHIQRGRLSSTHF